MLVHTSLAKYLVGLDFQISVRKKLLKGRSLVYFVAVRQRLSGRLVWDGLSGGYRVQF